MSEPASESQSRNPREAPLGDQPGGGSGQSGHWRFFVDVGGTFTDVVAEAPDGRLLTHKCLSTSATRGTADAGSTPTTIRDPRRGGDPHGFWVGHRISVRHTAGAPPFTTTVSAFDPSSGTIELCEPVPVTTVEGLSYELRCDEHAPVVAIRYILGLSLHAEIGLVDVLLGTTRATNALLERKGAAVAFVTTRGFGDVLKIGYQDRPRLFDLHIRKRDELAAGTVEIDERIAANGDVLKEPTVNEVREQLKLVHSAGIESLAICFLHAHVNPAHERIVAEIAREVGFEHVTASADVCRLQGMVPRGDTCVVDAYVDPVIRSYIASLRRSLPRANIRLMTSSGGLIGVDAVRGKDTLLSGPAGGVVACAHVAREAGFDRVIGFDMGGTSTDVSRIELAPQSASRPHQSFEYQHETVQAGVRLMVPMLAIETVAAGGGSICRFDGQKLTVGPESAGADPGPACYGTSGPLTVTDINLSLGRILPDEFPFPLDRAIVQQRLQGLCDDIRARVSTSYAPVELADGFRKIANANMAAAIKRVSIAKGYDVREYALCSFGGAGGQHACAVAELLGIERVFFPPFGGVLSAFGIGVADIKRIEEQSTDVLLDDAAEEKLRADLNAMVERLRAAMLAEGADPASIEQPSLTYDLCYAGQGSVLPVPVGPFDDVRRAFGREHRRIYGYVHENREIEVRAIRVELVSRSPKPLPLQVESNRSVKVSSRFTQMVVDGMYQDVPVLQRAEFAAEQCVDGPAVIVEDTGTIVIDAGWTGRMAVSGAMVLNSSGEGEAVERVDPQVNPTDLELFNNRFTAIAQQMGETLRRTALSTNVKERLDFSCAIFTPQGDLVVNAPHIPVHLGAMSDCVKALIADAGPFQPGDVYITNDPYRGGSHLNDVTVVTPVHDQAAKRLQFFVASRAHHAEIGGTRPGSMPPDSTTLAEEGVLIQAFRWMRAGRARHNALNELLTRPPHPSRAPHENMMDIAAQVAANQTGVRELGETIGRYGEDIVLGYMMHVQRAAEVKMRDTLSKWPNGCHRFEDTMDNGATIRLQITVEGDQAVFDFGGTSPVVAGNLNANRAIVTSAILYCLRCLIDGDIPLNSGVLAPISIKIPDSFLNPPCAADPRDSPAVVGGNVETSQRVVDCVFGALRTVAASQGTMNNVLLGDANFGYYETICGGAGAGPGFAGASAVQTHMTNTRLTDPEVLESRYPVRLVRFTIREGSGGKGRYVGGDGVIREMEFLAPLQLSILSQRRTTRPYGVAGGEPGMAGRNLFRAAGTNEWKDLPAIASLDVNVGDRVRIETPGGGGWGVP